MRPGPNVTTSTSVPPNASPTNTGTWFVAGTAGQGPETPVLCTNFAQYQRSFGERGATSYSSTLFDAVEQFFLEGGSRVYVARAVGATAVAAKAELEGEAKTGKALVVAAVGKGTWAENYEVVPTKITGGAGASKEWFTLEIKNASGAQLEVSPVLRSQADAVAWAKGSAYVTITAGPKNENPEFKAVKLTGGKEPTEAELGAAVTYDTAIKKFIPEYGPGQLSVPGGVGGKLEKSENEALVKKLFEAATTQQRRAVVDIPNNATEAEMKTFGAFVEAFGTSESISNRNGALYGSWQTVAPALGLTVSRVVPPSAFVAAKAAVIDAQGNPNIPIAGKQAILAGSLAQSTSFGETEMEALYNAGVNLTKVVNGQVRIYGNRTAVNRSKDPLYAQFSNSRLDMAIIWKGLAIEETMMFTQLDGQGKDQTLYGSLLKAMMLQLYNIGAVFGNTPQEAYSVDVAADVNTPATLAEGNLNATIAARRSPGADQVNLNIVRVGITQEV